MIDIDKAERIIEELENRFKSYECNEAQMLGDLKVFILSQQEEIEELKSRT